MDGIHILWDVWDSLSLFTFQSQHQYIPVCYNPATLESLLISEQDSWHAKIMPLYLLLIPRSTYKISIYSPWLNSIAFSSIKLSSIIIRSNCFSLIP